MKSFSNRVRDPNTWKIFGSTGLFYSESLKSKVYAKEVLKILFWFKRGWCQYDWTFKILKSYKYSAWEICWKRFSTVERSNSSSGDSKDANHFEDESKSDAVDLKPISSSLDDQAGSNAGKTVFDMTKHYSRKELNVPQFYEPEIPHQSNAVTRIPTMTTDDPLLMRN